jgi:hypothetical protein
MVQQRSAISGQHLAAREQEPRRFTDVFINLSELIADG